jgi:predicted nucleic-acid-binding protein
MVLFDANMILRFLLADNAEMAEEAERYLNESDVWVTVEVIAEVVYVLGGVYAMDRTKIADIVVKFLTLVSSSESDVLAKALEAYKTYHLDFVDCVLFAYHKLRGVEIATFDKKLIKLMASKG